MKAIYGLFLVVFFSGCGYSTSQRRVVSGPAGVRMSESRNCVGLDCGGGYGYDAGYGQWAMSQGSYQGLAPSWGRFGAIETYRAQNRWVRSPGVGALGETRDSRLDRLAPHLQRMANALCRNGTLTGDDCALPDRMRQQQEAQPESRASTASTPAAVTGSVTGSAASQGVGQTPATAPLDSGSVQEEASRPHSDASPPLVRFSPRLTADELR